MVQKHVVDVHAYYEWFVPEKKVDDEDPAPVRHIREIPKVRLLCDSSEDPSIGEMVASIHPASPAGAKLVIKSVTTVMTGVGVVEMKSEPAPAPEAEDGKKTEDWTEDE